MPGRLLNYQTFRVKPGRSIQFLSGIVGPYPAMWVIQQPRWVSSYSASLFVPVQIRSLFLSLTLSLLPCIGESNQPEQTHPMKALIIVDTADHIVEKRACDSFMETGLEALLRSHGVEELIIVGCATDFCVDTTIRAAASRGFRVTAVSDGHTTRDRPHLRAMDIITHHNYMWENLQLPRQQRPRVVAMDELVKELKA